MFVLDKIKAQPHNTSVHELKKLICMSKSIISRLKKNEKGDDNNMTMCIQVHM